MASYLKNNIKYSSGFAVVANNKVENISLKFKLEVDDDSLKEKTEKVF